MGFSVGKGLPKKIDSYGFNRMPQKIQNKRVNTIPFNKKIKSLNNLLLVTFQKEVARQPILGKFTRSTNYAFQLFSLY